MRYKFTYPTYTGYPWVDSPIPSCAQTWENANPSTYESSGLCPAILSCVLNGTPVGAMAMFAAGSTILGFVWPFHVVQPFADHESADTDHSIHGRHQLERSSQDPQTIPDSCSPPVLLQPIHHRRWPSVAHRDSAGGCPREQSRSNRRIQRREIYCGRDPQCRSRCHRTDNLASIACRHAGCRVVRVPNMV